MGPDPLGKIAGCPWRVRHSCPTVLQRPAPTAQDYGKPEEHLNPHLFRLQVDRALPVVISVGTAV